MRGVLYGSQIFSFSAHASQYRVELARNKFQLEILFSFLAIFMSLEGAKKFMGKIIN